MRSDFCCLTENYFFTIFIQSVRKLWFGKLLCQLIIKVWSTFSKVVGVGKAHKYFHLHNLTIAEQLTVWRLEHNGASL